MNLTRETMSLIVYAVACLGAIILRYSSGIRDSLRISRTQSENMSRITVTLTTRLKEKPKKTPSVRERSTLTYDSIPAMSPNPIRTRKPSRRERG